MTRATRYRNLAGGLAAAGLVMAACGGSSSPAASRSSSTTTAAANSSSGAAQLTDLQVAVESAKRATFKARYSGASTTTGGSGAGTNTVTIEQKPPKSLFSAGNGGSILNNGSTTYYCSNAGGRSACLSMSASANPLAPLLNVYNGSTALTLFQQWRTQLAARVTGADVNFTTASFAGQHAKCVTWSYQAQSAKYCVTDSGILAYAGGTGSYGATSLQLTSYSTDVSDSDFNPPAGAIVGNAPQR